MKVQWRTITEWEFDTDTKESRVLRAFTIPVTGYKKKAQPVKMTAETEESGVEHW